MKPLRRWLFNTIAATSAILAAALIIVGSEFEIQTTIPRTGAAPLSPSIAYRHWTISYQHYHQLPMDNFILQSGGAAFGFATPSRVREFHFPGFQWQADWQQDTSNPAVWNLYSNHLSISAALPIPLLLISPAVWLRLCVLDWRRKKQSGIKCATCGYDLRATPDRCPECGTNQHPSPQICKSPAGA